MIGLALSLFCWGVSGTLSATDSEQAEKEKPLRAAPLSPKTLGELGGSIHLELPDDSKKGLVIDNANLKELGADGVLSKGGVLAEPVKLPERERNSERTTTETTTTESGSLSPHNLQKQIKALKRAEARSRRDMLKADPERKKILRRQIATIEQKRRALEAGAQKKIPPKQ